MFKHKGLDSHIREIKALGNYLMPFNCPRVSIVEEEEVNCIKGREIVVDGYTLIVHFNKSDREHCFIETLQVLGKYTPFLPFAIVCKVGKKFLGEQYLSLVEFFKDGRKIYCWTIITDKASNPVPGPQRNDSEDRMYEGFQYQCLDPGQIDFY